MSRFVVTPPKRPRRPRPVAVIIGAGPRSLMLVDDDGALVEAHGPKRCRAALEALSGHAVYTVTKMSALLPTTGATEWFGYQWSGPLSWLKLDGGPKVYPLGSAVKGHDPFAAVAGIRAALDWLAGFGIAPGSKTGMAWNLWRSTLARPVVLIGPPEAATAALYGGRQEAPYPGDYAEARYHDLGAAYPASMAAERYPNRLVPVSPTTGLEGLCGLARASVRIPALRWCPLPVRVARGAVCFGYGDAEGWWPIRELVMARDAGADVTIHELHVGIPTHDLFGPWWQLVRDGRQLPGAGGSVVKALTSSLWGSFGLDGDGGAYIRWLDYWGRRRVRVPVWRDRDLPHAAARFVACETTSRVRERLWREALSIIDDALYCDTDAVVTGLDHGPDPAGLEPGSWRVKATMVRCEIRGPQVMRHTCPTCARDHAEWHYTVAGAPTADVAERVFARASRTRTQFVASLAPGDVTLPRADLSTYRKEPAPC